MITLIWPVVRVTASNKLPSSSSCAKDKAYNHPDIQTRSLDWTDALLESSREVVRAVLHEAAAEVVIGTLRCALPFFLLESFFIFESLGRLEESDCSSRMMGPLSPNCFINFSKFRSASFN